MARPVEAARPHKLKGYWFLVRRVPGEFSAYDRRNPVRISTGIRIVDDPRGIRAAEVVTRLQAELLRYWKDKRPAGIEMRRRDTSKLAIARGRWA